MAEPYPMKGDDDDNSYFKNSSFQKAIDNAKSLIDETIAPSFNLKDLLFGSSSSFNIADLGCLVGPNTFICAENIIGAVKYNCQSQGLASQIPEFQVFFNDHVFKDFNTLFKSLPPERGYFAAGLPGSFHVRLFPRSSLHFIHTSSALHWISQVPGEILDRNSPAWNKGRIFYTNAPYEEYKPYATRLLFNFYLNHAQRLVSEVQLDSFNLPMYIPYPEEILEVVERNKCFSVEKIELFKPVYDIVDVRTSMQAWAMHLRAGLTGMLKKYFGNETIDELFDQFFKKSQEFSCRVQAGSAEFHHVFLALKRI
ncbi:loganic acid O-methyltransferase [Jatropha curcas]|uniref:loganic acid O-methyltransferase n=1 Tax=Jatropha curcas TaxID=180498 RepID=UPI0018940361|nr:loganic acid O-methyltransferase [Jatropha curcas]